jgi:hypothetical protein
MAVNSSGRAGLCVADIFEKMGRSLSDEEDACFIPSQAVIIAATKEEAYG